MDNSTSGKLNRYTARKMLLQQLLQPLVLFTFLQLFAFSQVLARDNGDDIIMTKGKLILRGGKGRGNLIVDTGAKSHEHHEEPMSHFNPFSYFPVHDFQQQHMILHPDPIMNHEEHYPQPHYQEHNQEYHHEVPQAHYEHHHEPEHQQHYQPEHHSAHNEYETHGHPEENHERPQHMEIQESTAPVQNEYNQQEQPSQQEETTAQQYGAQSFQSNPMMSMMMHGTGNQPTYQQLAAFQLMQNPNILAQQHQQLQQQQQQQLQQQQLQALQELRQQQLVAQQSQQQPQKTVERPEKSEEQKDSKKPEKPEKPEKKRIFPSLLDSSSNSPLATIIKPLLNLNPMRFRKKEPAPVQQESSQ